MTSLSAAQRAETIDGVSPQCQRRCPRSNTFLMATVLSESFSGPVRIKNISASGAMLSANTLPNAGEMCRLRRGESAISGTIIRVDGRTAAMRFAHRIFVEHWLGTTNQLQEEVDRQVSIARHRYPVADTKHLVAQLASQRLERSPSKVLSSELEYTADQLDQLAIALSRDSAIIARFGMGLQVLDIASQRLRALAVVKGGRADA